MKTKKDKEEKVKEEKVNVKLEKGKEDVSSMQKCIEFILSMRGQLIIGQALANSIKTMESRMPEMWREPSNIKDMKFILRNFGIAKALTDVKNLDTKYFVKKNGEVVVEYDDAIHNSITAVEVAKHMHSVDQSNYYSASVEVTFSPVLIEGGSKEPQEIGMWSSDSVSTDDEFDFEGA
tara:strand:+ start:1198 stop:1731 length:534 start_codon:yes stop_codon:yes gene_type:complete